MKISGSPMRILGCQEKILGSPMRILGSPTRILGSPMRMLGSPIKGQVGSPMKWGLRWVSDDEDFFPNSFLTDPDPGDLKEPDQTGSATLQVAIHRLTRLFYVYFYQTQISIIDFFCIMIIAPFFGEV